MYKSYELKVIQEKFIALIKYKEGNYINIFNNIR